MKKTASFLAAILLFAGLSTSLSSCSDDDKNEPEAPAAQSVVGSYTGDMSITVMGSTETSENITFTLAAADDTHATLTFPTYGNPPMKIESFNIENLSVSKDGEAYKIARTGYEQTLSNGKKASGVIEGDVKGNQLNLKFTLQYGSMPMAMTGDFTGSKK